MNQISDTPTQDVSQPRSRGNVVYNGNEIAQEQSHHSQSSVAGSHGVESFPDDLVLFSEEYRVPFDFADIEIFMDTTADHPQLLASNFHGSPGATDVACEMLMIQDDSQIKMDQSIDPYGQLAFLQHKLARKSTQMKTSNWDLQKSLELRCQSLSTPEVGQSSPDLLAELLDLVSELHSFLVRMSANIRSDAPENTRNSRGTALASTLSAMSCYLQIRALYDFVLAKFLEKSSKDLSWEEILLNSTPCLHLGRISIQLSVSLVGRILVQLMMDKVSPIEAILGIPVDLRISKETWRVAQVAELQVMDEEQASALLKTFSKGYIAEDDPEHGLCFPDSVEEKMRLILAGYSSLE